ncbi:MAG: hypothetical protein CVU64_02820 [Deltaproteobacteria bacterium HGW-Deltaproteobacteria-21]|nr:MAG: hypothetical protein CVU64_02820 [Deltaproteobacteria bacterium HGW-Deltaproteobacteria-21]
MMADLLSLMADSGIFEFEPLREIVIRLIDPKPHLWWRTWRGSADPGKSLVANREGLKTWGSRTARQRGHAPAQMDGRGAPPAVARPPPSCIFP